MTQLQLPELDVSRETRDRLEKFTALVQKWSPKINLVASGDLPDLWARHVLDSTQVYRLAPKAATWLDMGSGGGFPGLISAIIAQEKMPQCAFSLIESDKRKAVFLRTASRETATSITVIADRIENVLPAGANILTARALAPLPLLLSYHSRHAASDAIGLYQKGINWKNEVTEAQKTWHFECEAFDSKTQPGAAILKIQGVSRV